VDGVIVDGVIAAGGALGSITATAGRTMAIIRVIATTIAATTAAHTMATAIAAGIIAAGVTAVGATGAGVVIAVGVTTAASGPARISVVIIS
jgi:hypothetical protein